jgi:DNA-binding NarL/FixJ family response regulator
MLGAVAFAEQSQPAQFVDVNIDVLIVEDHPMVAEATANLLRNQYPQLRQTIVTSAAEALTVAQRDWFRIFLDLNVPGAQGLSLVRAFSDLGLANRCCIVTAAKDIALIDGARRLGVLGYIEKSCPVEEFCRAVQTIVDGQGVYPSVATEGTAATPQLTTRQLGILRLLHRGLSSKEVARELNIAEGTVKNQTLAAMRALDASNRTHAVARAINLGLLASMEG